MRNPEFRPKIVIGLGNPDATYEQTYHNAGLLCLDEIARRTRARFKSVPGKPFRFARQSDRVLVYPLVPMNESGRAVALASAYFKAQPEELLLIHDDSDISLGAFKFSFARGAAGHHGVESVIKTLRTNNFWRLRIGIRPRSGQAGAPRGHLRAHDFVLLHITKRDKQILQLAFKSAIENVMVKTTPSGPARISVSGSVTD